MEIFLISFFVVGLAVLGMAVGTLAGRQPLKGGCGEADCADRAGFGCPACGTPDPSDKTDTAISERAYVEPS